MVSTSLRWQQVEAVAQREKRWGVEDLSSSGRRREKRNKTKLELERCRPERRLRGALREEHGMRRENRRWPVNVVNVNERVRLEPELGVFPRVGARPRARSSRKTPPRRFPSL